MYIIAGMVYMIDGDAGEALHVVPSSSTANAEAPTAAAVQVAPASTFSTSSASASDSDTRNSAGIVDIYSYCVLVTFPYI